MTNELLQITHNPITGSPCGELTYDDFLFPSLDLDTETSSVSRAPEKDIPLSYNCKFNTKDLEYYGIDMDMIEMDDDLLDDDDEFEFVDYDSDSEDVYPEKQEEEIPFPTPSPFWFGNEDEEHVRFVINEYSQTLIKPEDRKNRAEQPFVSRVKRINVSARPDDFETLDLVTLGNCQRMPLNNLILPVISSFYCLTSWSSDGIPIHIVPLSQNQINFWLVKLSVDDVQSTPSFLYCKPDWNFLVSHKDATALEAEYHYSVSSEYYEITYHGLPSRGDFAPYVSERIPRRLLPKTPMKLTLSDCD